MELGRIAGGFYRGVATKTTAISGSETALDALSPD